MIPLVPVTLNHYLVVAALLFSLGLYGALTRRNAVAVLMCLELMFNSVNLNLVAFSRFLPDLAGMTMAIFVITVAAAEVTIGVAIVLSLYRNRNSIDLVEADLLKD